MQPNWIEVTRQNWTTRAGVPWMARFLGKFVHDIVPTALASAIGAFLFAEHQFGHPSQPQLVAVQPASPEVMAMIRDEHAEIMDYLKAQVAAERSRNLAADAETARAAADSRAAADAKLAEALIAAQAAVRQSSPVTPKVAAAKPSTARAKPPVALAAAPHVPLTIAQAQPVLNSAPIGDVGAPVEPLARDPDSLLAKTLDIKDHVVAATRQVVSAIGDAFASVGNNIGGVMSGGRFLSPES